MSTTVLPVGSPQAVKRFGSSLAVDTARESYWTRTMIGFDEQTTQPIQGISDLAKVAGDEVTYDLSLQLKGNPIYGDNIAHGNEEAIAFAQDKVRIDQVRHPVNTGGKMTQKRTLHNLRMVAKARLTEYWSRLYDEYFFVYLSGARGINNDYILPYNFPGFAGNMLTQPDSAHVAYGGSASSKASLTSADKMSLAAIDKIKVKATMMGGGVQNIPAIQPVKTGYADGAAGMYYILLMSPLQMLDLRTNTNTGSWLDIQKAAAAATGTKNPIFEGGAGIYNGVVMKEHAKVIRFNDYGAGANVAAARALFLGRQAGVFASGSSNGVLSFDWAEELDDYGNQLNVLAGSIFGIKKNSFTINGTAYDFGMFTLDTAIDASVLS
jgi:N4-gp56 family major capsid protein